MKRFIYLCALLMGIAVGMSLTGCGTLKPQFDFSLDVSGIVADQPTNIQSAFDAHVANVLPSFFENSECLPLDSPEGASISKKVDKYIERQINRYTSNKTSYDIFVDGYVLEKNTGLKFSVRQRWSSDTTYLYAVFGNKDFLGNSPTKKTSRQSLKE